RSFSDAKRTQHTILLHRAQKLQPYARPASAKQNTMDTQGLPCSTAEGESAECGSVILRDGRPAVVRIALPQDHAALRNLFQRLSPESRRQRFASMALPSPGLIASLSNDADPHYALTLLVCTGGRNEPRIIATGSYVAQDQQTAEVAFAVDDAFQGKGLGKLL